MGESQKQLKLGTNLVDFDTLILADDTGSRTRRVEQDAIEPAHDLGELATVDVRDDDVAASETSDVTAETLDTTSRGIVGPDLSRVAHQRRHVRRLSSRCGRHIETTLVGLRVECHDGQERRRRLEDVVTGEVFGRGTDGHVRASREDLETDLRPSSLERFEVDSSVDQRLREVASTGLERVDSEGERSGSIGGGEEFEGL